MICMKNRTTYLYFDGKPLYPFGYGPSYTSFDYTGAQTEKTSYGDSEDTVTAWVTVEKHSGTAMATRWYSFDVAPPESVYTGRGKMLSLRQSVRKGGR